MSHPPTPNYTHEGAHGHIKHEFINFTDVLSNAENSEKCRRHWKTDTKNWKTESEKCNTNENFRLN